MFSHSYEFIAGAETNYVTGENQCYMYHPLDCKEPSGCAEQSAEGGENPG